MSLSLAYPRVTTVGDFLALLKPRVMPALWRHRGMSTR